MFRYVPRLGFVPPFVPPREFFEDGRLLSDQQPLDFLGERAGDRTQDLLIKSQLLYR